MQATTQPEAGTNAPPAISTGTVIEPVRSLADRDEFIDFQLKLYAGDPDFVAPIVAERRDFLDPRMRGIR